MNLTVISKLNLQMHRYVFHLRSLKSLIKATVDKVMTIEKAEPVVFNSIYQLQNNTSTTFAKMTRHLFTKAVVN